MRDIVIDSILYSLLILMVVVLLKPLKKDDSKIVASIFAKSLALYQLLVFMSGIIHSLITNAESRYSLSLYSMMIFTMYCAYAIFQFRYQISDDSIKWFNGIFIRRVLLNELKNIQLRMNDKKIVTHIDFVTARKKYRMRNDIGFDKIVARNKQLKKYSIIEIRS